MYIYKMGCNCPLITNHLRKVGIPLPPAASKFQVEELKFSSGGPGGRRQAVSSFFCELGEIKNMCSKRRKGLFL